MLKLTVAATGSLKIQMTCLFYLRTTSSLFLLSSVSQETNRFPERLCQWKALMDIWNMGEVKKLGRVFVSLSFCLRQYFGPSPPWLCVLEQFLPHDSNIPYAFLNLLLVPTKYPSFLGSDSTHSYSSPEVLVASFCCSSLDGLIVLRLATQLFHHMHYQIHYVCKTKWFLALAN